MVAQKLRLKTFSGAGFIHSAGADGLAAMVRGIAQDNARVKLELAGVDDLTDDSTGVATGVAVDALVVPTALFDATANDGAPATAFNTAIGVFENVGAVFVDHMNNARVRLGLPLMTFASGTIATAGTITAMTKSLSGVQGATAIEFAEGIARMKSARDNLATLARGLNEVLEAIGDTNITDNGGGTPDYANLNMVAIADAAASSDGADSIDNTVMDSFLDELANGVATLADRFNDAMAQADLTDLSDDSTGVVSDTIADVTLTLVGFTDGGTNSSPQAGLDAEMNKLDNNFADLAAQVNILLGKYELTQITDSSGGSVNTTLEVINDDLTAVDGTSNSSAPLAGTQAIFDVIAVNIATLAAKINLLVPFFGIVALTDNSGATATSTLSATSAIGAGVDNGAAATGLADSVVDDFLSDVQNAQASLAGKLNEMTGEGITKELKVVAALP